LDINAGCKPATVRFYAKQTGSGLDRRAAKRAADNRRSHVASRLAADTGGRVEQAREIVIYGEGGWHDWTMPHRSTGKTGFFRGGKERRPAAYRPDRCSPA
jgi:hypothetical protein